MQNGESPTQAMIREFQEETGLSLAASQLEYVEKVYVRYPDFDFVYHMYKTKLFSKPARIRISLQEHLQYRWISLKEALKLPLIPGEDECIYLIFPECKP